MGWDLKGNSATNPPADFLGTTDNKPLVIKSNGSERLRVDTGGNIGVGTTTPAAKLEINNTPANTPALCLSSSVGGASLEFNDASAGGKKYYATSKDGELIIGDGKQDYLTINSHSSPDTALGNQHGLKWRASSPSVEFIGLGCGARAE